MAIYQSMQRVRFSSADGYKKFQVLFADVRRHLKPLPGFLHLTWWVHPDYPTWFNEVSFWTSKEALEDWHMTIYHKQPRRGRRRALSWRISLPTSSSRARACFASAPVAVSSRTRRST